MRASRRFTGSIATSGLGPEGTVLTSVRVATRSPPSADLVPLVREVLDDEVLV
jgi:hypothetical protein